NRTPSPVVEAMIRDFVREKGEEPREHTQAEILDRLLQPMVEEGKAILAAISEIAEIGLPARPEATSDDASTKSIRAPARSNAARSRSATIRSSLSSSTIARNLLRDHRNECRGSSGTCQKISHSLSRRCGPGFRMR
ncbi:MAG: hypothetical protein HXY21_08100, partial [Parvularculaceae bacterium]|nr:hypothetical protein [Parvularculaceae bacterium]